MNKKAVKPKELKVFLENNETIVIDVRGRGYFLIDHIKDSINIENYEKIGLIAKENIDKKILLYCHHGVTAKMFLNKLKQYNINNVYYVDGSFTDITKSGIDIIYHV